MAAPRNRWPTGYWDPDELRCAGVQSAAQVGSVVAYLTANERQIFIAHVDHIGSPSDGAHQTRRDAWLRETIAPRTEPVAGFVVSLRSTPV